jgi:hypothetical protein
MPSIVQAERLAKMLSEMFVEVERGPYRSKDG